MRAVGEHPRAADTVGIRVLLTRYRNVILGGMVAGIGGAYFTLGSVGRFDENMTAGRGFIGLAAMIFGRWNPVGAFLAALVFGFADSLQTKLSILNVADPLGVPPDDAVPRDDPRRRRRGAEGPAAGGREQALHQGVTGGPWASREDRIATVRERVRASRASTPGWGCGSTRLDDGEAELGAGGARPTT